MRPEDRLQARCRMFLDAFLPHSAWWSSIAHERKQTPVQGAAQKARGVRPGLPDIFIFAPGYVLGVELKAGSNSATAVQRHVGEQLRRLGHGYEIVRSVEALGDALVQHGFAMPPGWTLAAQRHDAALAAPRKGKRQPPPTGKPSIRAIARGNRLAMLSIGRSE